MVRARGNRSLATFLLLALAATACANEFDRRYTEAERLRAEAAELGWEWIETGKLLDQAREMAEKGDDEGALALVEKARFQADAAIKQAEHEAEAWKQRVAR